MSEGMNGGLTREQIRARVQKMEREVAIDSARFELDQAKVAKPFCDRLDAIHYRSERSELFMMRHRQRGGRWS